MSTSKNCVDNRLSYKTKKSIIGSAYIIRMSRKVPINAKKVQSRNVSEVHVVLERATFIISCRLEIWYISFRITTPFLSQSPTKRCRNKSLRASSFHLLRDNLMASVPKLNHVSLLMWQRQRRFLSEILCAIIIA